jgi:hypothetical protein
MFFTLKSSILVISGYLRTVQVAPGHPVMPCESLGKSLQTCLSQDKSGFPDVKYQVYITNTIIDPIIYFKERNSYFFETLHDGWHFTTVNNIATRVRRWGMSAFR